MKFINDKINNVEGGNKYAEKLDQWSTHTKISSFLKRAPASSRILDVGCSSGIIAKLCQNERFLMNGIEENPEWAELAQPYYAGMFIGKVENATDDFLSGYDYVILADVLEHIPDCEKTLKKLYNLQKKGCIFIISVPNIANIWIRLKLLLGKFEYQERGILDKTHMKFFTYKSLKQLLSEVQLNLMFIDVTPIPLGLISNFFSINKLGIYMYNVLNGITRIFRKLFGYQFVAFSKK